MKKAVKLLTMFMMVIGLVVVCGSTTSCKSTSKTGEKMYTSQSSRSHVVNKNYKIRGNNKKNRSTYRTY